MGTKTDNANPAGKLALRRHFLRRYHAGPGGPIRVFDCCQATGFLWRTLAREFILDSCWGVDLNPKKGRLKIDSARVLDQPGLAANVVDVDTYGSPWKHWLALLRHAPAHPVTVFLTIGNVRMGGGGTLPKVVREALGLTFERATVPMSFTSKLLELGTQTMLGLAQAHGLRIVEAQEAPPGLNARYLGIRLERAEK